MKDPTREEMLAYLSDYAPSEEDDFFCEEAMYWFACDHHNGQWSNLYSALSTSPFRPSPFACGCSEEALELYHVLVEEYCPHLQ
jgi:hypothetical protein